MTVTGQTSLAIAMNTPVPSRAYTLDSDPEVRKTQEHWAGSGVCEFHLGEVSRNTLYQIEIRQLTGNSRTFDFRPYCGRMDLVFIDVGHTYKFVLSDLANAMKVLSPRGWIIWDEYLYKSEHPECAGVEQYLGEILPCGRVFALEGTHFAIFIGGPVEQIS